MKGLGLALVLGLAGLVGCSRESRSPDAIRRDTANVTAGATRDAKAVALGVVDGLRRKGPVNINKAPIEELERLPGMDAAGARRIVAGRPYESGAELVKRRVVTKAEYHRIASQVVAR